MRIPGITENTGKNRGMKPRLIDAAVGRIARAFMASAEEDDGTPACPDCPNFRRINLALDYGQTGVMMGLAVAGRYLEDEEISRAARKVADYVAERAVPEGGGLTFPQLHPLPQQARDR